MGTPIRRDRERQKQRTRSAVLAAAARLVGDGKAPSVAEAAEAAEVSRRTAYRYFPSQEQMLAEATLEALRPRVEGAIAAPHPGARGDRVETRLDRAVRTVQRETVANEALLRSMIRLTAGAGPAAGATDKAATPRRGYRRIGWIEMALEPVRASMPQRAYRRLVAGVALCVGIEALLVLRDVCGLSVAEAELVSRWAARALLDAAVRRLAPPRRG